MKLRFTAATIVALLLLATSAASAEDSSADAVPVSEPPVKLVHVLNPGEREYLSPNLIGVQNIAMTFLPLTMNFINIIDAFREIVNGVRYEIHLNAVDTREHDAEVICRLVILEKPWLTTEWGDKVRELQHSNCTSDVDNLTDPAARSDALNNKYQRNALFNGGSRNELSTDEMSKLHAQIMDPSSVPTKPRATTSTSTTTTTTTTTTERAERATEAAKPANEVDTTAANDATADADEDGEASTPLPELSDDEKKWLDDIFSVGALNFENSRRDHKHQKEEIEFDGSGESNYVHSSSSSLSKAQQTEQPRNANDYQPQQQQQEEEQLDDTHARAKRGTDNLVGGLSQLDAAEAESSLQASLDQLASGDGPSYKISKIHSATIQMVSGTLTRIDADLIDADEKTSRCDVEIWSRVWLPDSGSEVTVRCPNKEVAKVRYSRSVEYAEKKTHKKHDHHNLDKTEHLFNKFQAKFNRRYTSTLERQMRLRIFKQNLKTIQELNRNELGSAKYGITEFADMTSAEYKMRTGLWQRADTADRQNAAAVIPSVELPKEFDWREKGAVSEVKNQGSCGSCWAFSVTGNIEGLHAVKTGKLEEYSEQELLDCDTEDSACNGGLPDNAYDAILKIGGLELESDYPYQGRKEQCHFNKTLVHVKVKAAVDLPKNETAIAQWLITNGPISIGINANAMQFYRGGVSHPWKPLCSHSNLDHGVLIVGYGVSEYPSLKKNLPYWIIKNSWGRKWGEQGYYRVYRGDNTCGVSEMASSAVLADA